MQLVPNRWYQLYQRIMFGLSAGIFGVALLALLPPLHNLQTDYNLQPAVIGLSAIHLIYSLLFYSRIATRRSYWLATFCSCMLVAFSQLYLIEHSYDTFLRYVYILPWVVMGAFAGIFGLSIILAWSFLTLMCVIASLNFDISQLQTVHLLWVGGTFGLGILFYMWWEHLYIDVETRRVNQLTGVANNRAAQSQSLIQSISDGVVVVNNEGRIVLMNPAAAVMTEWNMDEALSLDVRLICKFAQENGTALTIQDPFTRILHDGKHIDETLQLIGKDGKTTIVSLVISPVLEPKSRALNGAVAVIRDVSLQRHEEHQRAEFISTASHEMRTPVAAIEGYLALALNDKVSTIDTRAREYLEKAHASTQHLGTLFQDLLTSAKAEDGRLSSHPVVIELGDYLERLAGDLRFVAQKKQLAMEFVVGSDAVADSRVVRPLYYAYADPDRLREVVTNLFDNAVKYTEQGKITIGLTGDDNVVQFYIRDTGAGIPAEDIPHLFQKFYRVDSSTTRTIGGTGLGLFISRKIIELYKGRLWAESELGKGSTFFVDLPRLNAQKAAELQAAETTQNTTSISSPGTHS